MKTMGAGAAALCGAAAVSGAAETTTPPNVVVILCDQLRSFEVGCYGHPLVRTPNIDRLASQGVRFDIGVTNSPTCTPARSNLLTGQYCRTCAGARGNEMTVDPFGRDDRKKHPGQTLPEAFRAMGYHTAQIGKWHIDTRPALMGFDESLVTRDIFSRARFSKNEGKVFGVPGFSPDHEADQARSFFERDHEKPFFLYYNIISPHMPLLDVPYQYSHMYDPDKVLLRDNVWKDGKLPHNETWFQIYMWQTFYRDGAEPLTARTPEGFDLRDLTALYDGSVTWVDDTVGLLMDSLEAQGLSDNTIVVFTSDHGDLLGSHHLWNKARLYDEAVRVPMIARWPGRIAGGVENTAQVTSLVDVMPTVLDLCGENVPDHVQGHSLGPILRGETETLAENHAIIETPYRELGIRTPTHLYGVQVDEMDDGIENDAYCFFDTREDPFQMNDLAAADAQRDLAAELLDQLRAWRASTPKLEGVDYNRWV